MPTFVKYWLYQTPGLVVVATLLLWAGSAGWITGGWALALLAAWVVKDAAFYPLTRDAYRGGEARHGHRAGQLGTVRKPLAPRGTVVVNGTLWNAVVEGAEVVGSGATVRIVKSRGLVLVVAPEHPDRRV